MARETEYGIEFGIYTVYYTDKVAKGYSETPVSLVSDDIDIIEFDINRCKESLLKPILWYGNKFPEEYKN